MLYYNTLFHYLLFIFNNCIDVTLVYVYLLIFYYIIGINRKTKKIYSDITFGLIFLVNVMHQDVDMNLKALFVLITYPIIRKLNY
jgi:hypothetical protein